MPMHKTNSSNPNDFGSDCGIRPGSLEYWDRNNEWVGVQGEARPHTYDILMCVKDMGGIPNHAVRSVKQPQE